MALSFKEQSAIRKQIRDIFSKIESDKTLSRLDKNSLRKQIGELFSQIEVSVAAVLPEGTGEPEGVKIANDILAGKYDSDVEKMNAMLDNAAASLEAAGLLEQNDALLQKTADYYTTALDKAMKESV